MSGPTGGLPSAPAGLNEGKSHSGLTQTNRPPWKPGAVHTS